MGEHPDMQDPGRLAGTVPGERANGMGLAIDNLARCKTQELEKCAQVPEPEMMAILTTLL